MKLPIIEFNNKFEYMSDDICEILSSRLIQMANLVYNGVDVETDTCNIIKNRYGCRGIVSLQKLEEFKQLAIR